MSETFFGMSEEDRISLLRASGQTLQRNPYLLEKDAWVVWALQTLFELPAGEHLTFKGGTSLSKCYQIIQRFSEDVDLTCDIRAIAPDWVDAKATLPTSGAQARKLSEAIRNRLPGWIATEIVPSLTEAVARLELGARIEVAEDRVWVRYDPLIQVESAYVDSAVQLEFGARSKGTPHQRVVVTCDMAAVAPEVLFPTATTVAMLPTRTFWEKATAAHVYCLKGRFRGDGRYARHWHDLSRLSTSGVATEAIRDRELALEVAAHKNLFFVETDSTGERVDYTMAVDGNLRLVPDGQALADLEADYALMITNGLLPRETESFADLMAHCAAIEDGANRGRLTPGVGSITHDTETGRTLG